MGVKNKDTGETKTGTELLEEGTEDSDAGTSSTASDEDDVADAVADGLMVLTVPKFAGGLIDILVPAVTIADPKLCIILKSRLSSYLGDYGAGRVVNTFTLYPGESTTITISTYKTSTTTTSSSENILEGYSTSAAQELEDIMSQESSESEQYTLTDSLQTSLSADASGSASTPLFSAEVEVSASEDTSSATSNAAQSTATTALSSTNAQSLSSSSNREVTVNTTSSTTTTEGTTETIVRTISNVNVSRTLNFIFRQMNQQFYTFMHITDIEVGFFNGIDDYTEIVPLYSLPALLNRVVKAEHYNEVYGKVRLAIEEIRDYSGAKLISLGFLETRTSSEYVDGKTTRDSSSYAVNYKFSQTFESPEGYSFEVPGVIIGFDSNVVRTEGVMCEAILGEGVALDEYSQGLQKEKVREKVLTNNALELANKKTEKALSIVAASDSTAADVYRTVFEEETTTASDEEATEG